MVGFRVFDVGLLVLWLVWFFRLRDDEDGGADEDGPGGGGPPREPPDDPGGGGLTLPLGRFGPGSRQRDSHRPRHALHRRGSESIPAPAPSRVRNPVTPVPAHRRD